MRISTGMIYDAGVGSLQRNTSTLLRTQQQISSGRRILTPADDPVAAAAAMEVTQSQGINKQYQSAHDSAKGTLGIMDGQLSSANDLLTRIRELTVQGGNAALSGADRRSIATELRTRFEELISLGNSTDGTGQYLFSGYQGSNKPFAGSVENGVIYGGDEGQRTLRVSGSRNLPISDSGNNIFMRIKNGNGVFATGIQNAKSVNATHITYEGANLINPPATTGSFEMRFWTDTAGTVKTSAQAVGTVNLNTLVYPRTFTTSVDNPIDIVIDGVTTTLDLDTIGGGTTYNNAGQIVAAIQGAVGAANATVSLDTGGNLVITDVASGAPGSTLALADAGGGGADSFAAMFGVPIITSGANGLAGATYFDLVNTSGDSLYTHTASTSGGVGNTYTQLYQGNATLNLSSAGPFAFDYGTAAVFTGSPADGDSFTIDRTITAITVSGKTFSANAARAVIDAGTVGSPRLWQQGANGGKLELRFWTDVQGTVMTSGQAVGNVVIPPGLTVVAGTADQFTINVDGAGARTVTVPPGSYATPANLAAAVQAGINALAAPPVAATVSLDAGNHLVVTSAALGNTSSVALAAGAGVRDGFARLFGAPTASAGITGAAGATYYDLVDATSGNSTFTGGTSRAGGVGNTYSHPYVSGAPISLSDVGGPGRVAFDFGAAVTVTGIPAGGDVFTIQASTDPALGNGYFITAAKEAVAANMGSGIIGTGEVLDQAKWNSPYNSRQLEVRFWKDPTNTSANAPVYYDLVDAKTEKSLFTDSISTAGGSGNTFTHAFKGGDPIPFNGLAAPYGDFGVTATINGTPSSGDVFTLGSSISQSIFETIGGLINALESPVGPAGSKSNAELQNKLGFALTSIAAAGDNIDRVRADIGTRLGEVDDLSSVSQNLELQYSSTLSTLQDIDYAKAITDLTRMQTQLQAAQQSFAKVSQLSLFNYL